MVALCTPVSMPVVPSPPLPACFELSPVLNLENVRQPASPGRRMFCKLGTNIACACGGRLRAGLDGLGAVVRQQLQHQRVERRAFPQGAFCQHSHSQWDRTELEPSGFEHT